MGAFVLPANLVRTTFEVSTILTRHKTQTLTSD